MIEAVHLSRVYREDHHEVRALSGVSLRIPKGEFLAIAGPSGSGKTTFLNLIGGLDRPSSGKVLLDGLRLDLLPSRELARLRRKKIGFVFQSYNLLPVLSAVENVELGMMLRGEPSRERMRKAREMLREVGLSRLLHRRPGELSGGQQQRVAVARALAGEPEVVLADEPTANLDSRTAEELMDLFAGLNRDRGVTFVFSSHDPLVLRKARRVVRFKDGQIT